MTLDLKKLFPNSKFPTAEELKAKEDTFSVGDRVKVSDTIRCRQHGQTGTIVRIDPEDEHNWKSFIVKFDDEKYNSMGFNSGSIDKIDERETTMKLNENTKVTLTVGQLKRLVKESYGHEDYGTRDLSDAVTDEEKAKIQNITDEAIEEMKNVFDKYIRNLKINAYRAADNATAQWLFSEIYQAVKKATKLSSGVGSTDKLEEIADRIKSLAADAGVKLI